MCSRPAVHNPDTCAHLEKAGLTSIERGGVMELSSDVPTNEATEAASFPLGVRDSKTLDPRRFEDSRNRLAAELIRGKT